MKEGMKLAFRLGLGLLIVAVFMMFFVAPDSAEFWALGITAVIDLLFCGGILLYHWLRRK